MQKQAQTNRGHVKHMIEPRKSASLGRVGFVALVALIATFVLPTALCFAAEPKSIEPLKLRLGLGSAPAPALPNSVLWLAKDLGFYKREGLDVELTEFQGTPL